MEYAETIAKAGGFFAALGQRQSNLEPAISPP
jgi:hypothetical protein